MNNNVSNGPSIKTSQLWPDQYIQKFTTRNGKEAHIKKGQTKGIDSNNAITLEAYLHASTYPGAIAFATLSFDPSQAFNFLLEVKAEAQMQGIGRKLFQTIVALARTSGIQMLVHAPVKAPNFELLEKWKMQKWIHIDELESNKLVLRCSLNQRFV